MAQDIKKKTATVSASEKSTPSATKAKSSVQHNLDFAFGRENYILLFVGLAFLLVGYLLMIGGGSEDPNVFNDKIFDFQRLTLSPILLIIGFVIEIFAIMKKPKN